VNCRKREAKEHARYCKATASKARVPFFLTEANLPEAEQSAPVEGAEAESAAEVDEDAPYAVAAE
jgi:hypothetical protein